MSSISHARPVGSFQDFVSEYQIHRKPADAESEDFTRSCEHFTF